MNKIFDALKIMHSIDVVNQKKTFMHQIHPCVTVATTIIFVIVLISFSKYNVSGLLGMSLYLLLIYNIGELSIKSTFVRLKEIFIILLLLGIPNLFFDKVIITEWFHIPITGGILSFLTLYLKGILAVISAYFLIATTGIEKICYALQVFHLPKILITVIILIYRYIIILLKEAERMSVAYALRAPGQKGIHYKAWGSMIGYLLIRSINRAEIVYDSMQLRGFNGCIQLDLSRDVKMKISIFFGISMVTMILFLRFGLVF